MFLLGCLQVREFLLQIIRVLRNVKICKDKTTYMCIYCSSVPMQYTF